MFKILLQDISPRLLNSFILTDSGEILWFVGTRKRIMKCIFKHEERTMNQVYCHAVISQHVLHLTFLPLFSPPLSTPADVISLGRPEEDQRVVLGLGGHVTLHQHQPAMVARRAQRLGLLRLPGASPGGRSESQPLHGHQRRPHLRKTCRWERMTQQRERERDSERRMWLKKCETQMATVHFRISKAQKWLFVSLSLSCCSGSPQSQSARPCKTPCSLRTSCANCTSQAMECMWCSSTQRCVDSSAYVISFPYGQCLEWQTQDCSGKRGGWKSDGWRVTDMYHTGLRSVNVFSHKCWKSDRTNSLLKVNFLDHFSWSSSGNSFQTLKHKTHIKRFSILSNASNHLNFL